MPLIITDAQHRTLSLVFLSLLRFQKWNSVGIVRCYDTDDESSIDVEFHDTAVHHSLHFDNQNNYTMADVSPDAVILAAESNLENPRSVKKKNRNA